MIYFCLVFFVSFKLEVKVVWFWLEECYGLIFVYDVDIIVVLGGDGLMLDVLYIVIFIGVKVYGMNFGLVGFLMNDYVEDDLFE